MSRNNLIQTAACVVLCLAASLVAQQQTREGFKDTPILPNQKWHAHDSDRPYPRAVTPGATLGAAPSDATILFDGKNLSKWAQHGKGPDSGKISDPKWKVIDGVMEVNPGTGDLFTRDKFGDCQLHIEWQESADITGRGQARGNSGVYIMSRYEIQVLDSYQTPTYADGMAGAIYGQWPPLVNPSRKPGEWQSYDIVFESPRFEGEKVIKPAYLTLLFNGVLVHNHKELNGPTEYKVVLPYKRHDPQEPLLLQDHGTTHPVRYRNIWVRPIGEYDQGER